MAPKSKSAAKAAAKVEAKVEVKEEEKEKEEEAEAESDDDDDTDEDMPTLEGTDGKKGETAGKQNRAEKKSRKAVQKLGLKPVPGIQREEMR